MTDLALITPFVWAVHGYATARKNDTLKFFCYPLLALPVLFDIFTGNTKGYTNTFNVPAWQFLIIVVVALLIIVISWLVGYGIGKLQGGLNEE